MLNQIAFCQLIYNFVSAFGHHITIPLKVIYDKKWTHYTYYNMAALSS